MIEAGPTDEEFNQMVERERAMLTQHQVRW
jgi:hypothetical protein